jgi:xanthine dehydrogenase molybdenum-binding subunit
MGLGFALTEEFRVERGVPQTMTVNSQGLLRARHMPEVELVLIEDQHPDGPYGAKGVGEIGLVPTAGAVAGALYSYDKIRRFSLPMKDSPAARYIRGGPASR